MDKLLEALFTIKKECASHEHCDNGCPLCDSIFCEEIKDAPCEWSPRKDGSRIYIYATEGE